MKPIAVAFNIVGIEFNYIGFSIYGFLFRSQHGLNDQEEA